MTHEVFGLPSGPAPVNHGSTRSAWVLTIATTVGALITGVGAVLANSGLMISGIVVIVVGAIASAILRAQGHGQPVPARSDDWYEG